MHFQRVSPRALSSRSHSDGPSRIDPTNEICYLPVRELRPRRSNGRGGSRRIHRSMTHVTLQLRVSEVLVAPTHSPPNTRTLNLWIRGARGVNSHAFSHSERPCNPWLLPNGSRPFVLRTRKTFPFRYFHITIFLSSHPKQVRDVGFKIHTTMGVRGKYSLQTSGFKSTLFFLSQPFLRLTPWKPSRVKLGIQFISGKCEFPRRWKHTHNMAISHRDVHIYIKTKKSFIILTQQFKAEKRLIRIRQCEATNGRGACFHPTIG
jgi:hypothetical protein